MTRGFVIKRISGTQQINVSAAVIVQFRSLARSFFPKVQTHIVLRSVTRNTEGGSISHAVGCIGTNSMTCL